MSKKLTTAQAARMVGVTDQTVANWIDHGQLTAGRTPGGHRRIEVDDLVAMLKRQNLRVPAELARGARTILIVADDSAVSGLLAPLAQQACPGYRVLTARDGFSVGEIVAQDMPDIIILDLSMRGLDGLDVCRRIKARPAGRDTVVIAIAADPSSEARKAIFDAGAAICLAKPLKPAAFESFLRKCVAAVP